MSSRSGPSLTDLGPAHLYNVPLFLHAWQTVSLCGRVGDLRICNTTVECLACLVADCLLWLAFSLIDVLWHTFEPGAFCVFFADAWCPWQTPKLGLTPLPYCTIISSRLGACLYCPCPSHHIQACLTACQCFTIFSVVLSLFSCGTRTELVSLMVTDGTGSQCDFTVLIISSNDVVPSFPTMF